MTTFTTADRLEEEDYLRKQLQIQQNEIDRLNGLVMQLKKEILNFRVKFNISLS